MLTLKRFLCALLTLCSLPLLAADSTIGNLTPITTVPDAYRMPWENPGVLDYYITFQNLTNQILTGYASQAYANGAAQAATNGYPWGVLYDPAGAAAAVTNGFPWGVLYYPMTSNPSNYVTETVTNGLATTNWVGANYYPLANPSNFVTSSGLSGYALLAGTNLFTKTNIFEMDALGTTIVPTVILTNATAAALGAPQNSPALMFGGQGWRSGNSTTMPVQMGMYVLPVQSATAPSARLVFVNSISNAANTLSGTYLSSAGALSLDSDCSGASASFSKYTCGSRGQLTSNPDGVWQLLNSAGTAFTALTFGPPSSANWPEIKVEASTNNPSLSIRTSADANYASLVASNVTASGVITATNNITWQTKASFTTNFTATTNIAIYCCSGTNQLITLPNCTTTPPFQIYRFSSTNGYGSFILTNATGTQTIRDGTSLSFTQIGIGSPSFYHDGAHWWPAARTKTIMANAQFSCSTNIPMTLATTAYPVTFNSTDFNNSQGIALLAGTGRG